MRACWLKWVGRDWSISADYIWLNYSGANSIRASWCQHCEFLIEDMQQLDNFAALRKNLFTVSEDSTIEEASVHEGDFPIYID